MSNRTRSIAIRPKDVDQSLLFFDGYNAIEVAKELQGQSLRVNVEFHNYGEHLSVATTTQVPADRWISTRDGAVYTKEQIEEQFDVVDGTLE